jgi:hypothetical protein
MLHLMAAAFVGVWKLLAWDFTDQASGQVSLPWEGRASGEFRFDENGGVAVQMMRRDRPLESAPGGPSWAATLTPLQRSEALDGYLAYWGTYAVDFAARTLHLHLDGALRLGCVNGEQQRRFEFSDDARDLTLYYAVEQGTHRLTWRKTA